MIVTMMNYVMNVGNVKKIIKDIDKLEADDYKTRIKYFEKLFKKFGKGSYIEPPFHCDYGYNVSIGNRSMFNVFNVILDCGPVTIGNDCLFSPGCQIITVTHSLDYKERKNGIEYTKPVKIGNDCFFGAGCIVLPGVTIGDRVVIAAGSVVSTDIESDCVVGGNPAKVLRKLTDYQKDKKKEELKK
ncbi:isoleucine patch superfamily-like protein [Piromyces finnis]|uniref:Isoleucine patch superfamily-like protein n=1 Tax=Piromyces finnis TaxID=1754191 RepID=A0A1Y1V945_9FUNG|nr:isoleucine patch superfamily-like protein [Piromyces finnis]|eukprot:ORX50048.1 isoleucine patch superfamily-like protein [Piromyces finnis]